MSRSRMTERRPRVDLLAQRVQCAPGHHGDVRPGSDPLFTRIVAQGGADDLETALAELAHFT
jgi:hypothetical protein